MLNNLTLQYNDMSSYIRGLCQKPNVNQVAWPLLVHCLLEIRIFGCTNVDKNN